MRPYVRETHTFTVSTNTQMNPKTDPLAPEVTLSGTSAEALLDQYNAVVQHLQTAEKAIREAYPHGRDHQTEGSLDAATAAHREVLATVVGLADRYSALAELVFPHVVSKPQPPPQVSPQSPQRANPWPSELEFLLTVYIVSALPKKKGAKPGPDEWTTDKKAALKEGRTVKFVLADPGKYTFGWEQDGAANYNDAHGNTMMEPLTHEQIAGLRAMGAIKHAEPMKPTAQ